MLLDNNFNTFATFSQEIFVYQFLLHYFIIQTQFTSEQNVISDFWFLYSWKYST